MRLHDTTSLDVAGGVLQALKDDGLDVSWQGLVTHQPGGHKLVIRCPHRGTPYVLLISDPYVWICLDNGSTVARYDLNDPKSLDKIAHFIKTANPPDFAEDLDLPSTTQVALEVGTAEYDTIVADWNSRE